MMQTVLTNARLILEDEVVTGTIAFDETGIASVDQGKSSLPGAIDVGCLIEFVGDAFERG